MTAPPSVGGEIVAAAAPVASVETPGAPARARAEAPSALDEVMPVYDFHSRHEMAIGAPAAQVVEAVEQYTPSADSSRLSRLLFRLRGFTPGDGAVSFREALEAEGFRMLAERPGSEIVFGITGRFWSFDKPSALEAVSDLAAFRAFAAPGAAKAVMGLRVQSLGLQHTLLMTETRVACVDAAARRRFALYWGLIKPASGWIRREMLRAIAHRAARL